MTYSKKKLDFWGRLKEARDIAPITVEIGVLQRKVNRLAAHVRDKLEYRQYSNERLQMVSNNIQPAGNDTASVIDKEWLSVSFPDIKASRKSNET